MLACLANTFLVSVFLVNELFAALYLDEDMDVLIATLLRAKGFSVQTARDAGMLERDDAEHFAYAAQHDLVMVTHNRDDFVTLFANYAANERPHGGVVVALRRSPFQIADLLVSEVLNRYTKDEMHDRLLFV